MGFCEKVVIGGYCKDVCSIEDPLPSSPVVCTVPPVSNFCEKVVVCPFVPDNPLLDSNIKGNVMNYIKNDHACCIGEWDVSRVTDMSYLFSQFASFNQDLGSWNVAKVTTMYAMFYGATSFDRDLGKWNVAKVTDMIKMFYGAKSFNQKLCWDLSHITDLVYKEDMFSGTLCKD